MTIHIPEIDHTQLFLHIYAATLFALMLGWSYKRAKPLPEHSCSWHLCFFLSCATAISR